MYSSIKISVKLADNLTRNINSSVGVKQGCVLSPTLFNIFLHDLPAIFDKECHPVILNNTEISCLMYADDIVILSQNSQGLQNAIDNLSRYCGTWNLKINLSKTKIVVFNKGGHLIKRFKFHLNQSQIESVSSYRYLGIDFSCSGNFKIAIGTIKDKAMRALFKVKQFDLRSNVKTAIVLFNSLVMPIIRYCSEIWAPYLFNKLNERNLKNICDGILPEKVHIHFCKYILGLHKNAVNDGARAELGSYPLAINLLLHALKYWSNFRKCDTKTLVYQSYLECHRLILKNQINWLGPIKQILNVNGFNENWNNMGALNKNKFILQIEKVLKTQYEEQWSKNIQSNPTESKLRTYARFKKKFEPENYVFAIKNYEKRKYFSKLRVSAHDLHIETGRYKKPTKTPVSERICHLCSSDEIEDEYHVIIKCNHYSDLRTVMFDKMRGFTDIELMNEDSLFIWIMNYNDGDSTIAKLVTDFVHNLFEKRKNFQS